MYQNCYLENNGDNKSKIWDVFKDLGFFIRGKVMIVNRV